MIDLIAISHGIGALIKNMPKLIKAAADHAKTIAKKVDDFLRGSGKFTDFVSKFGSKTKASWNKLNGELQEQFFKEYGNNTSAAFLQVLKNGDAVKAWEDLFDFPNLRIKTNHLEAYDVFKTSNNVTPKVTKDEIIEVLDGAGISMARIFTDRVVASGRSVMGQPGNKILNRFPPIKNVTYEVDGIEYVTDNLGRVSKTSGDLDGAVRVRLGNQQIRAVDVKDGVRGTDQGGHIIGARFFGAGEQINYYPQATNLNQGSWKTMENEWADAMVAGKDVKVDIRGIYNSNSFRPDKIEVEYWIDGDYIFREFDNL